MTYATLQTDIAEYLHRSDIASFTPSYIARAEASLFRELQLKDLAVSVTGTTTGEYADLPADFGTVSRITATVGDSEYNLDYRSPDYSTTLTYPSSYALENNKIRIFGTSTGAAYTLYYIPNISALSDTNTTNWLLTNAADLYLYASALEGARATQDDAMEQKLVPLVSSLIDSVRRLSERKGHPTNSGFQIKPRRY